MAIPGSQIRVPDRPINRKAVSCRPLKIQIAPSLHLSGPKQRLATGLIAPDPIEGFVLYVGVFGDFDKKMLCILPESITTAYHRVLLFDITDNFPSALKLPGIHGSGGIILDMVHFLASFQHQRFKPFFGQLLGCPSAAHSGSYDDG